MKIITKKELQKIKGGINISAAFIKAIVSTFQNIIDAGRNIGSSIRRLFSNNICPLK